MAVATTSAQGEAPHALSSVGGGAASSMSMSSSIINDAPEQQYSLRWNDFPASMISNFRHLRDHLDFVDVTLACSKNTNYLAHKVVLSACSPYFRSILKDAAQCTHPVIIMRDVPHTDIEQLLSFMYHGEVAVSQNQLPSFLKTAEMLQIRGLTDSKDDKDEKQDKVDIQPIFNNTVGNTMDNNTTKRNHIDSVDKSPTSKRRRSYTPELTGLTSEPVSRPTSGSGSVSRMGNNAESLLGQALEGGPTILTPSKKKHRRRRSTGGNESDDGANSDADVSLNDSQIKSEPINDTINDTFDRSLFHGAFMNLQQAASYMPGPSGIQDSRMVIGRNGEQHPRIRATDPRPCPKCGKVYRSAHTLRTHMEDKHTICPGYRCVLCGTIAKSRNSLHSHMSRQHRGISTKDLPVVPMPAPFDPELAVRLFAKAGHIVDINELRARASPTNGGGGGGAGGGGATSSSSLGRRRYDTQSIDDDDGEMNADDPQDLTMGVTNRYATSTPNSILNKFNYTQNGLHQTPQHGAVSSASASNGCLPPSMSQLPAGLAAFNPLSSLQGQPNGSNPIVESFLQLLADNSSLSALGQLGPEQVAAYTAQTKALQMSALRKLANSAYGSSVMMAHAAAESPSHSAPSTSKNNERDSSVCEDDTFSDELEPDTAQPE
ncbi:protein abrupt isoform X1 [Trichogramma pretiosum]|uniref:protein abrupt isoform X1 n=1 Tax=Trichogramma pretiosum TaxID=7493 RepID=UPI0006C987DE|nr:protein abrupt isoform X1 [Trichogramma pretiosum]XP_014235827.1 protein abrupt isoform X1 [Trichogramma pretiosum]